MTLLDYLDEIFEISEVEQPELSLEERFNLFHTKNPQVYQALRKLALDLAERGHRKIGIGMLYEVVRWQHAMRTTDESGYKLNNDYRSRYARLLMSQEPRLFGVFETRKIHD